MKEWRRTQNFIQLKCFCERSIKMWHFIEPIQYKLGGLNSGIQIEIGKICLRPVLHVPPKNMQSKGCTKPVQTLPAEAVDLCNRTATLLLPFVLSPFTWDFPLWFAGTSDVQHQEEGVPAHTLLLAQSPARRG